MNKIRDIERPRIATILAALALLVVLGGTATAASGLINGKKIKKGTITAKQIKNRTITTGKLAGSTLAALKGAQGPRGEKGATGAKGAAGPKGDPGAPGLPGPEVVTSFSADGTVNNVPANDKVDVVSMNGLDSSRYLIIAKAVMFANTGGALLRCAITTSNDGGSDEAQWSSPGNATRTTVPMVLTTAAKVNQAKVECDPGDTLGSFTVDVSAIPIG